MNANYEQMIKHLLTLKHNSLASGNKEEADKLEEQGFRLDYVSIGEGSEHASLEQLTPQYASFGDILHIMKEERGENDLATKLGVLKNTNRFFILWKKR